MAKGIVITIDENHNIDVSPMGELALEEAIAMCRAAVDHFLISAATAQVLVTLKDQGVVLPGKVPLAPAPSLEQLKTMSPQPDEADLEDQQG